MALPALVTDPLAAESAVESAAFGLLERAHARAVRATTAEMATALQELLGQKLTAAMTGVDDPKAVGKWARGERAPRAGAERRLRQAFHVASLLTLAESAPTARAWLMGMNPLLADRAPALVFAEDATGGERVMRAARAFLAHG